MNKKYISIVIVGLISIMLIFSMFNKKETTVSADTSKPKTEEKVKGEIYVEIKGAVAAPGVYKFKGDKRIFDVIDIAGGLLEGANISYINQSRILEDQMLIVVMTDAEINAAIEKEELIIRKASEAELALSQKEIVGYEDCYANGSSSSSSGMISINKATKEELMTLTGIGEVKANDIIAYRQQNGNFNSIEELMEVNGIGEATFNKIKANITV